nr:very hypothetical protein SPBC428.09c - fission yeast (Schizosaccharomyces pombe) [Schizosaccharomyces pombe]
MVVVQNFVIIYSSKVDSSNFPNPSLHDGVGKWKSYVFHYNLYIVSMTSWASLGYERWNAPKSLSEIEANILNLKGLNWLKYAYKRCCFSILIKQLFSSISPNCILDEKFSHKFLEKQLCNFTRTVKTDLVVELLVRSVINKRKYIAYVGGNLIKLYKNTCVIYKIRYQLKIKTNSHVNNNENPCFLRIYIYFFFQLKDYQIHVKIFLLITWRRNLVEKILFILNGLTLICLISMDFAHAHRTKPFIW